MATLANLARMTTATTGTGTITLGAAVSGFLAFAQAGITNGQTVSYAVEDGNNREVGRGVYTATGTTLTRSVLTSTNSNAAISLSGSAQVFISGLAEDFVSPGLVLLQAQSVSSAVAAVDFTSGIDSAYDEYELHVQSFIPVAAAALYLRTSTDGGANFDAGASDYTHALIRITSNASTVSGSFSAGAAQIDLSALAVEEFTAVIRFNSPTVAQRQQIMWDGHGSQVTGTRVSRIAGAGSRLASADVNGFRLLFNGQNISSGKAKLYGGRSS